MLAVGAPPGIDPVGRKSIRRGETARMLSSDVFEHPAHVVIQARQDRVVDQSGAIMQACMMRRGHPEAEEPPQTTRQTTGRRHRRGSMS